MSRFWGGRQGMPIVEGELWLPCVTLQFLQYLEVLSPPAVTLQQYLDLLSPPAVTLQHYLDLLSPPALFKLLQLVQTADWEFFWRDVSGEISQSVEPLIIPHLPTSSPQPPDVLNIQEKVKSQACQLHSSSNVRKVIEIHIWLYMIYALFEEINCYQKETNYFTFWSLNQ